MGPGEDRFARHGRRHKEGEGGQSAGANASAPSGGDQNAGASAPSATAGLAQQPSGEQNPTRESKHRGHKGEVVPSSLPPGSPSPYVNGQSGPEPNATSESPSQDENNGERKHRKHKENADNPDQNQPPPPQ